MKSALATVAGCLAVLGLTVPAFADTSTPLNVSSIIAQAKTEAQDATQENQTQWQAYQTLVGQVTTALGSTSTTGSLPSSYKAATAVLSNDLASLSQSTTLAAAKASLSQLEKDAKRLSESLGSGSSDGQKERVHSLQNAVTESNRTLKKWLAKAGAQVTRLESEESALSTTSSKEQVKRVAKDTRKLANTEDKVKRQFAKWEQKLQSDLKRISLSTTSSNTKQPTPPAPPSSPTGGGTSGGSTSGSTSGNSNSPTPPAPPAAP